MGILVQSRTYCYTVRVVLILIYCQIDFKSPYALFEIFLRIFRFCERILRKFSHSYGFITRSGWSLALNGAFYIS